MIARQQPRLEDQERTNPTTEVGGQAGTHSRVSPSQQKIVVAGDGMVIRLISEAGAPQLPGPEDDGSEGDQLLHEAAARLRAGEDLPPGVARRLWHHASEQDDTATVHDAADVSPAASVGAVSDRRARREAAAATQLSNIRRTLTQAGLTDRPAYDTLWDIGGMVAAVVRPDNDEGWEFASLAETYNFLGEQRWLWPGYIPLGHVTLCVGPPEVGKTFLAQAAALVVAGHEQSFPDGTGLDGETGTVLWMDYEGQLGTLASRIAEAGQSMDRIISIDPRRGNEPALLTNPQECVGLIRSAVDQYPDLRLVVIDSLSAGSPGVGENSSKIAVSLNALSRLASELGIAVMVLHHATKSAWKPDGTCEVTAAAVRGSGAIMAAVRSCIAIDKPTPSDIRRVHLIKASLVAGETRPEDFGFYLQGGRVTSADTPTTGQATTKADEFRLWLGDLLVANGPTAAADVKHLANEAGFSDKIINAVSREMVEAGTLKKTQVRATAEMPQHWVWELVADEGAADDEGEDVLPAEVVNLTGIQLLG